MSCGEEARNLVFAIVASEQGANHSLFAAYTNGALEIGFQWLMARPPFQDEAARRQLLRRLNAIDGVELPENGIAGRPNFPLARLIDAGRTAQFIAACEWAIDAIREASVSLPDMHGPLT